MLRVMIDHCGAPTEVIRVDEAPAPDSPGPHEAVVDLLASPIHPSDLLAISGMYAIDSAPMPRVPGKEGVGRVVAVGPLVKHVKPGDLTPILLERDGVWQERHLLPAENLVALPPGGDVRQYAMLFLNPATALLLIRSIVPLQMGEWLIQNAANSSVGQYVIQLARRNGIRSVNVVRREGLADQLHDLGADVVLVDGNDLPQRAARAIGGAPIRLAIDAVSGLASARLATCLAPGGVLCNYGMVSGQNVQVSPLQLMGSGITVRGFWLMPELAKSGKQGEARLLAELIPLVYSGALRAVVEATYPLDRVREAMRHVTRGERTGKILLTNSKGSM